MILDYRENRMEFYCKEMNWIQLKMIFRGWMRNKVYTVISVLSLVVGLTCSLLMAGFVTEEYRIADSCSGNGQWYTFKAKNIFYGNSELELMGHSGGGSQGQLLKNAFPEVEDFCTFHSLNASLKKGVQTVPVKGFFEVTPSVVDLSREKTIRGDLRQTLSRPGEIAVTRSFALSRFGREDIMGEPLSFEVMKGIRQDWGIYSKFVEETYTVTTVIDDSGRRFFNYSVLKGLPEEEIAVNLQSWLGIYYTFVRLADGVKGVEFEQKMRTDSLFRHMQLVAMDEVYFTPGVEEDGLTLSRNPSLLYIGISIALAVLVIACFNYINLGMTRTLQRLRNTGQQMVFGASKRQMRLQLIVETAIQSAGALIIALVLIQVLLPGFNALFGAHLKMEVFGTGITPWVLAALLLAVIIGPSLYIFSRLGESQLSRVLKQEYSRRPRLVTGMVVAQFVVSIILLLFVANVHRQIDFVAHNRPESESVLLLDNDAITDDKAWDRFCDRLSSIPEVEKVTHGSGLEEGAVSNNGRFVSLINGDENYFDFYDLSFACGRPFMASSPKGSVVVNETFVKKWEVEEPIGYTFDFNGGRHTICGVVKDFILGDLSRPITPLMIVPENGWITAVRVAAENRKAAVAKMAALWKEIASDELPFEWRTMAEAYLDYHREEQKMMKMVWVFSWISLLLTCLGLFGLAWYSVENRKREIALRKVNGATEGQVVGLLCGRFMRWIAIAFVLALPVAFYCTSYWLQQFVYREETSVGIYVCIGIFVFSVGMLTVIWQSWKAANRNPVEVLKQE